MEEKPKRGYVKSGKFTDAVKKAQRLARPSKNYRGKTFKIIYRKEVARMRNETMNELMDLLEALNKEAGIKLEVVKLTQPTTLEVRMVL